MKNIVLGCDPLLAPLTGIGKYTRSLAIGLEQHQYVNELELFAHGKFFQRSLVDDCNNTKIETSSVQVQPSLLQRLRIKLGQSNLATSVYSKVMPYAERYALRHHQECLFHSPNFLLPNFSGKKVVTIHDLSTLKFPEFHPASRVSLVNNAISNSLELADHIITDSRFIRDELINEYSVAKSKVSAVHLGVDDCFYPRTEQECQETLEKYHVQYKNYFLFVSTIEPRKNVVNLLAAYEKYRASVKQPLPLLMIGGKGWQSEKEHSKISQLEQKGYVSYLGYVPESALPVLYAGAKGLLFPSLYEGFGLPVAEALQSGVQVLTSKNSSMVEFSPGTSVFVEPRSVTDIADGIVKLHEDGQQVEARFDWQNTVNKTIEVYKKI